MNYPETALQDAFCANPTTALGRKTRRELTVGELIEWEEFKEEVNNLAIKEWLCK